MSILITGAVGFIGFHLSVRLLKQGEDIVAIDNFNDYYDPALKRKRLSIIREVAFNNGRSFTLIESDLEDKEAVAAVFNKYSFSKVVNLAAQAGVRFSIDKPDVFINTNIVGFGNILEGCRKTQVEHLVFASSSSVYGGNQNFPFSESDTVDHPVSLYAATKKSNELMAHSYSHLYDLPVTGLRFFTVYGPWGRPDMALFLFTKAILEHRPINVFNNGNMVRDFTYIDDIIESIVRLLYKTPTSDSGFDHRNPTLGTSWAPYRIFNVGNSSPVSLNSYIEAIEEAVGVSAIKNLLPMQPGDVSETSSDTTALEEWVGFKPRTSVKYGVKKFVEWYRDYYNIQAR